MSKKIGGISMSEFPTAQPINNQEAYSKSDTDVQVNELSGEDNLDESFNVKSIHSLLSDDMSEQSSPFYTGIIIMKTTVGVGILGIPDVVKNFGIIPTIMIILFVFACTNFSTLLLIKCKNLSKHSKFTTIAFYTFETRSIVIMINLIIILSNFGVCWGELIIFGTNCENLVSIYYNDPSTIPIYFRRWFILVLTSICMFPLLTVRQIEKLKIASLIAIISVSTFTAVVLYNFSNQAIQGNLAIDYGLLPTQFNLINAIASLPNVIFAFNWHFNQFSIHKGMKTTSDAALKKAAWMGTSIATLLYLIVGILGYMTYGNQVETNFLKIIQIGEVGKVLYIFLNVTFALQTVLTVPLLFFGARNNSLEIINSFSSEVGSSNYRSVYDQIEKEEQKSSQIPSRDQQQYTKQILNRRKMKYFKFYALTITLEVIIFTAAVFLTDLSIVFNLLGAISANVISSFLPALFYCKISQKLNLNQNRSYSQLYRWVKLFLIYSLFLFVLCVGSEIIKLVSQ